ncbi:MAG TPA: acetate/propionate family kinase [Streptosporangiaceae bacterium]
MRVLVVNTGSSSVKLSVVADDDTVADRAELPVEGGVLDRDGLRDALRGMPAPDAVGHRVVHGGAAFTAPVRLDADARRRIADLADLAPLHQPSSLAGIAAIDDALPGVPAVACFDTAFHASLPEEAATYPIPEAWRRTYGIRRYGFHGLSHAYASRRAAGLLGRDRARRVVTAHLGAGASLAAVLDGRSVDTTMGFTPLEGLAMATRSGSVDPGLVLWLTGHAGLSGDDVSDALEHGSGLVGLAGTGDMREVLARDDRGDADAALALGVYLHRLRAGIAGMAAALDGLDALVFTGGVGENAPRVRAACAAGLGFLGVAVDRAANDAVTEDADVSAAGAAVATLVVAAREDLEIAAGVRTVLASAHT